METQTTEKEPGLYEKNRTLIKGFLIGFLILVMLIPSAFIINLVEERQVRQEQVIEEVSSKWAGAQTIAGPILAVPYTVRSQNAEGKELSYTYHLYMLPETL